MALTKKYVEIKIDEKTIAILPIKECSPLEFIKKQKEAEKNLAQLQGVITIYKNQIKTLEKEIKILKGEE